MSTMEIVELSIAQQRHLCLIAICDRIHASSTSKELLEVEFHKCFLLRAQCSQHDAQSRPSYSRLQTWTILRSRTARLPVPNAYAVAPRICEQPVRRRIFSIC